MKRIIPLLGLVCILAGIAILNSCKKDPVIPTLTTAALTNITTTSVTSGGSITGDGGAEVTARGVCWRTSSNPTIADSHTSDDKGTGSFESSITGLTPNTLYYIRAYATNKAGTAYGAEVSFTTTAIVIPTLTTVAVTAIAQTTAVSGGDISSDGNDAVTARGVCYATTTAPTITNSLTTDGTGTGAFASNLTGLTAGTVYYIRAYATNSVGTAYGNELTFTTVLGAPTNVVATAAPGQATITFTAPAGNAVVTSYTVTSTPGSKTATGTASPLTVTGLTNGTAYTFTVVATNTGGNSPASAASNSVTPTAGPDAPTIGTATKGNAQATVTFTAPVNTGGLPITGYTVTSNPGNKTATGTASPLTVTGLTNGTAYTFTVVATNANGNSAPSAASNPVTPSTVPGAPTIGTATEGDAQVSVTFTAPANNGGSAITSYTVTSNPDNLTATGPASPIIVTGLTNGTFYTFTVVATNANGNSAASAASNSVRPQTVTSVYDIDNNLYNTVTINTQVWMATNLKTTRYSNGDVIATTGLTTDISAEPTPNYQWLDHDPSYVDISATYGRVYTWYVASDSRNVCPTGWHVPTSDELVTLTTNLGGDQVAGGKLKEMGTTHWVTPNNNATNDFNFTGLPAGARYPDGTYENTFTNGYFWSSTIDQYDNTLRWGSGLLNADATFLMFGYRPNVGISIRCLKN